MENDKEVQGGLLMTMYCLCVRALLVSVVVLVGRPIHADMPAEEKNDNALGFYLNVVPPLKYDSPRINMKLINHGSRKLVLLLPKNDQELKYFLAIDVVIDNEKAEHTVGRKAIAQINPAYTHRVELEPNESLDYQVELTSIYKIKKGWKRMEIKPTVVPGPVDINGKVNFIKSGLVFERTNMR